MSRISRRARLLAFAGLALVFAIALALLRPQVAALSDDAYVRIAKDTPQGQLFFRNHSSPCFVTRVWNVQVNCDDVSKPGASTEKFRVYIDPRRNVVIDVEVSFNP